ncbi:MAG TPA: NADP-dependent oxidoreductase [Bradyrhizobium sp.]|uniref:NADP-dependent oxidoreductase n=1 Tax=Bradyrhizobium sp. TaxID=376 RepID=UPI002D7F2B15|nr:NADP-dependent oxidoreductase [Bradyrhizobium sp.]HET7887194.1 NADP-dependent oxidoreductase [Bradyrhizobium sp.]
MRALVLAGYGGPDRTALAEVPQPVPGAGELLVRVHAAGLNPVDYKTRSGALKVVQRYPLPITMGNEFSGVVESAGPGVSRFAKGERVFARVGKAMMGAFAEYALVHEDDAAQIPASLDFLSAAAVPLAGLTALQALRDELGLRAGQRIFIPGGAGGVGTFAIQIAKHLGAYVATTASPRGDALVRRLGADLVIDYTRERFEDKLADYDCAFDLIGGDTLARLWPVLKPGGQVVSIAGMPDPSTAKKNFAGSYRLAVLFWIASLTTRLRAARRGAKYRYMFMHASGADLGYLASLIDAGKLNVIIDRVFPFAEAKDAIAHLENGHAKGKVVLQMC